MVKYFIKYMKMTDNKKKKGKFKKIFHFIGKIDIINY